MSELNKKLSIDMFGRIKKMSLPSICISPILSLTENEWKKFAYIMHEIKDQIETKTGIPFVVNAIDLVDLKKTTKKKNRSKSRQPGEDDGSDFTM